VLRLVVEADDPLAPGLIDGEVGVAETATSSSSSGPWFSTDQDSPGVTNAAVPRFQLVPLAF
jgi:hypothetical protein